jgi:hypothetical protein
MELPNNSKKRDTLLKILNKKKVSLEKSLEIPNFKVSVIKKLTKKNDKKDKKRTVKHFCKNYKKNIFGKPNINLYNSCKINQYCRKHKCQNIDKKFEIEKAKKLGNNNNQLLMASVYTKCPITISENNRKRCYNKAIKKFYESNNLGDTYNKLLECDNKLCSKERKIFYTNLFRVKTKKYGRKPKLINIEDIPDKEMIEKN